nr:MAG TPA: hypothetical protein [Caudoviricetes sp.]
MSAVRASKRAVRALNSCRVTYSSFGFCAVCVGCFWLAVRSE